MPVRSLHGLFSIDQFASPTSFCWACNDVRAVARLGKSEAARCAMPHDLINGLSGVT